MKTKGFKVIPVYPELAQEIGLNESLVLETLRREIKTSYKVKDNRHWYYHPLTLLRSEFLPFISVATISRAIASLREQKLIEVGEFNELRGDRTQWFSINVEQCKKLRSGTIFQNEKSILQNEKRSDNAPRNNKFQNEKCPVPNSTIFQNETTIQENTPAPLETKKVKLSKKGDTAPNGAKPPKKLTLFDRLEPEQQATYKQIFPVIGKICRVNLQTADSRLIGELNSAAAVLAKAGATVERLEQYEREWYAKDWRGQRGDKPPLSVLRAGWDQPVGGNNGNGQTISAPVAGKYDSRR